MEGLDIKEEMQILKMNDFYKFLQKGGLNRDLNPGPPAPKAGIIPLDHWATYDTRNFLFHYLLLFEGQVILFPKFNQCCVIIISNHITVSACISVNFHISFFLSLQDQADIITREVYNLFQDLWNSFLYLRGG